MTKRKVIFRADGNSEIGMGHIIRCLALAEMLNEHFECYFATRFITESIKKDILNICQDIIELENDHYERHFLDILKGDEIVVIDNYFFEYQIQQFIKDKCCSLVIIDDLHNRRFYADAIINHAPLVDKCLYKALPNTKYYLGLDYALLRRPFLQQFNSVRNIKSINSIFLCFGGSDVYNYTGRIFDVVTKINQIEKINIVIGNAYAHEAQLWIKLKASGHQNTKIYRSLCSEEMISIMSSSDMAIVPASSILFEVLSIGMPVITGFYIENQLDIYNGFERLGVIKGVGDFRENLDLKTLIKDYIDSVDIPQLIYKQKEIFNGQSAANLLNIFQSLSYESSDIS